MIVFMWLIWSFMMCSSNGRIILLTTFRKQRNNEHNEITRARTAAAKCAEQFP